MALSRNLIAIIAKKNPSIWEEIIGPTGPLRNADIASLNPQPLPPVARRSDAVSLNPQPIPPATGYGALVAAELVRAAGVAQMLGVAFSPKVDDICPPPRPFPPIPWPPVPWPPRPQPWREAGDGFDDEWVFEYAVGIASALEASEHTWGSLEGAAALEQVHEAAFATAERLAG